MGPSHFTTLPAPAYIVTSAFAKWLRRPDSNGDYRNQNPGCCRYTTAQFLFDRFNPKSVIIEPIIPCKSFHDFLCALFGELPTNGFVCRPKIGTFGTFIFLSSIVVHNSINIKLFHRFVLYREPARAVGTFIIPNANIRIFF